MCGGGGWREGREGEEGKNGFLSDTVPFPADGVDVPMAMVISCRIVAFLFWPILKNILKFLDLVSIQQFLA